MFHRDEDDDRSRSEGEKVSLYRKSDPAKAIEHLSFTPLPHDRVETYHAMLLVHKRGVFGLRYWPSEIWKIDRFPCETPK